MATPTDELHGRELQAPVGAVQVRQRLHQKLVVAAEVALYLGWWGRRRVGDGRWPSCSLALPSKPGTGRAMTPGWVQGWSRAGPGQAIWSPGRAELCQTALLRPISGGTLLPGRPSLLRSRCLPGSGLCPFWEHSGLHRVSPQDAGGLRVSSVQRGMCGDLVSCCSSMLGSRALSAPRACSCHGQGRHRLRPRIELWSCGVSCSLQPIHVHLCTHLLHAGWESGPLPVLGPTGPARRPHWDVRGCHVPRGPSTAVWGCCRQGPLVQTCGRGVVSCVAHPGGPECHGREATASSQRLKPPTQHGASI